MGSLTIKKQLKITIFKIQIQIFSNNKITDFARKEFDQLSL